MLKCSHSKVLLMLLLMFNFTKHTVNDIWIPLGF